jgi:hypothetical protein
VKHYELYRGGILMQFKALAFIFLTPGFTPETNSITTEKNGSRLLKKECLKNRLKL